MATIRDALAADAQRCGEVHVESWKAGYEGLLPNEYLQRLTIADRLLWWQKLLASPPEARSTDIAVAEDEGGDVCGFGATHIYRADPRAAEVDLLYVDPSSWGTGVSGPLLDRLVTNLAARGVNEVSLRVAAGNTRARRFYEREGWRLVERSEQTEQVWGMDVLTVEYRFNEVGGVKK